MQSWAWTRQGERGLGDEDRDNSGATAGPGRGTQHSWGLPSRSPVSDEKKKRRGCRGRPRVGPWNGGLPAVPEHMGISAYYDVRVLERH